MRPRNALIQPEAASSRVSLIFRWIGRRRGCSASSSACCGAVSCTGGSVASGRARNPALRISSKARLMRCMRATASALLLRSGCHCETRRRHAALTSRSVASEPSPSSEKALSVLNLDPRSSARIIPERFLPGAPDQRLQAPNMNFKKTLRISSLALAAALLAPSAAATPPSDAPSFNEAFKGYDACFLLYDVNAKKLVAEYNPGGRCKQRIAPNSTFKVPLSLMAFNEKLIDQQTVFKWSGQKYDRPELNRDQTPRS